MGSLDKFDTQEKIMDLVKECAEFYQQGELLEAMTCCDEIISLDPTSVVGYYNLGTILFEQEHFDLSNHCYDQIIKIDPKHIESWVKKGINLFMLEEYEESIVCFDEAIRIDPKDYLQWVNKG